MFVGSAGLRAGWGLLLFGSVAIVLFYLLFFILPPQRVGGSDLSPEFQLISEGRLLVIVIGATSSAALVERRGIWSYGLREARALRRFSLGAVWGLLLVSLLVGCLIATRHLAIAGRALHGSDILTYGAGWAVTFVVAAVAEESLFRGYLQFTLARLIRFWPAAILSSLAFGLVHLSNNGESALGVINAALAGALFCLGLRLSGSLWWGIGFHATWNWAQSFAYGAPASGYVVFGHLVRSEPLGNPWWSGGTTGPEASILVIPTLCLAALVVALTFRRPESATKP